MGGSTGASSTLPWRGSPSGPRPPPGSSCWACACWGGSRRASFERCAGRGFALAFGAILAIIGLLTVYGDTHSGRSASGLSAAIDMIVVLVGAGIGGVALIALWLVRIVKTTMQSSGTP